MKMTKDRACGFLIELIGQTTNRFWPDRHRNDHSPIEIDNRDRRIISRDLQDSTTKPSTFVKAGTQTIGLSPVEDKWIIQTVTERDQRTWMDVLEHAQAANQDARPSRGVDDRPCWNLRLTSTKDARPADRSARPEEPTRARNEASFGGIASLRLDYLPPRFASPRLNFQNLASPRFASSNFTLASLRLASDLRDQVAFIKFRVFFIIFDSMLSWYSPHIISRSSEIAFIKFGCKEKLENHYFGRVV